MLVGDLKKQTNRKLNNCFKQFKHPTFLTSGKSYSFSVGWDFPEAEGLVEGEGQCQGVFQSCDLQQTNRRL